MYELGGEGEIEALCFFSGDIYAPYCDCISTFVHIFLSFLFFHFVSGIALHERGFVFPFRCGCACFLLCSFSSSCDL